MANKYSRIAVVQIACHPALSVSACNYLREPFIPSGHTSLSRLGNAGLRVTELQERCKSDYLQWHSDRLREIAAYLGTFDPPPHIIVFPECSIPADLLKNVSQLASELPCAIFAGTHSSSTSSRYEKLYKGIGAKKSEIQNLNQNVNISSATLPILLENRALLRRKSLPSIFELDDVSRVADPFTSPQTIALPLSEGSLRVKCFVCSEALQAKELRLDCDLAIILAYTRDPAAFRPLIDHHVQNRIPVVLCNDGAFGGSGIFLPLDTRVRHWWWDEPFHGELPRGDSILVAEIDWDHLVPQVGVVDPQRSVRLIRVATIGYEGASNDDHAVATELLKTADRTDYMTQKTILDSAMTREICALQRAKLAHLHSMVSDENCPPGWWTALAQDCLISGETDLNGVEMRLAQCCREELVPLLLARGDLDTNTLGLIAEYAQDCSRLAGASKPATDVTFADKNRSTIINRQTEIGELRTFLQHSKQFIAYVVGLPSIGKSTVVERAVAESGHRHVSRLRMQPDITPETLAIEILSLLGYPIKKAVADPIEALDHIAPARVIQSSVVIVSHCELLLTHVHWRDPRFKTVFSLLADLLGKRQGKLILLSAVSLDQIAEDPSLARRWRIRGLDEDHAVVLLQQQIRRVGLDPSHYSIEDCQKLTNAMGGHPGAIVLISEYVETHGFDRVLSDLAGSRKIYDEVIAQIVRGLELTAEEEEILGLLLEARVPIPASLLNKLTKYDPLAALRSLWQLSLVDRENDDQVAVVSILRGYSGVPGVAPDLLKRFNAVVAKWCARRADNAEGIDAWRFGIAAEYHGLIAGEAGVGGRVGGLIDGALGAARRLVSDHKYEQVLPILNELLKKHRTPELLELASVTYGRLGKCDEALALAKEVVARDAQREWILTEVGRLALFVHRADVAEDAIRIAKSSGRDSTWIATLEGKLCLRKGRLDSAIDAFQRGVDISVSDAWPHYYLGRSLIVQGNYEDAIDVLHKGELLESERWRVRRKLLTLLRTQLGLGYLYMDDLMNADRWLKMVEEDDPANPEVARAVAYLQARQGGSNVAQQALQRLLPKKSMTRYERSQVHLYRALFFLALGYRESASQEFSNAAIEDPRNVFVLLRWCETLLEIAKESRAEGEAEAARLCAERARDAANKVLEYDKTNARAREFLESISDEFQVL